MKRSYLALMLAPFLMSGLPGDAAAAEGYDNCNGFIDSVPAVITTQGVWCLRADIATAIVEGAAVTIATNNVTIDCNDFKLGGLGGGSSSNARGIQAESRLNATVRNCAIRGFHTGISFIGNGSGGHLVEDNRLDGNLIYGINVAGSGNQVARNRVIDTGGFATPSFAAGINASADILDNTVDTVFVDSNNGFVRGISSSGYGVEIRGNRIRGLLPHGTGTAQGIVTSGSSASVIENRIATTSNNANDRGIWFFPSTTAAFCGRNTISGFNVPIFNACTSAGPNYSN